ncbi:carbohydrate ABC transporter membrane protein 2, CUT1 family [Alkalispirochaeta americana]|uniref:Carbohydrate ABC transporter membrane protein 2, CUT1 family n=1 Tax=Alkalispirochaeta americana TaxID=159291 RepID=A0A1N6VDT2_9SPIO|nr:carbohydrate ABC transporter permease [Alkalispirochaeta americana]SIQ76011.1 carbohydrate ABC transporter membrane protein 2, CUT1 family [Alkalispirochaeta americana]
MKKKPSEALNETPPAVIVTLAVLRWTLLLFYLVVALFPLVWLGISAFKTNFEIETSPFALPAVWQFGNFVSAVSISGLPRFFLNSIGVALLATACNLMVTSMGSFVIAREKFALRKPLFTIITAGVLVPIVSFMVPYYTLIMHLGLYDTLLALIITYAAINIPVSTFLISSFMTTIPRELEDSAEIDGCSFVQRYWKIIMPLSRSGLVTAGTFSFIYCWNEFIYALLLTSSRSARTVQLAIRFFTSQFRTDYAGMFAAIVLTMIPTVAVYIFFHDKIISGLTAGAVKG